MSPKEQKEAFLKAAKNPKVLKKRSKRSEKALKKITDNLIREGILKPEETVDYTHPLDLPHGEK